MKAQLKQHIRLEYPGYLKSPAEANVRIYEMNDKTTIVLISQPGPPYTGLSVTNGIERIVTEIYHRYRLRPDMVIEHYPAFNDLDRRQFDKPSFDLVEFTWQRYQLASYLPLRYSATSPKWRPLGQDGFFELTGLDPEGV